ncbi:nyctalopin-like [Saccostrea cucullata]|uniref:nyctalopin-like n=1 Tax=Saccostrea cuccullata TaxID=36930 RepID=UPI002ED5B098
MLQRNIGLIFCVIIVYVYGCPDKCSCNGTVVMCENQGFSFVPQDIPDKTTELFLGRNKIENITENQLGKGASLKKLYLYENRLSHIHPDAFTYLEQLEVLSASYNHLKIIKRQYFWKTIRLKLLDFSKNKIEMIEDGAFEKLPNLQNLRLNSNKIRAISNDTFRMVSGLEKLELQDNAIQTIGNLALRDLQNLRLLSMSKNELETLPTGLFNGLDLIEEIYQMSFFLNYSVLNKNFVNRVESHAFESLPALERVYLDGNNIKEMQKNCFGNGTKLDRLYLGSNPLRCDCGMKWLMDYVKTHHTSLELESREGSRVDVVCDEPDTLKGRRVLDLPENSFYCECRIPGIMYSGTENKTIKGLGCQYWSDQKPHRHDYDMLGMNQSNYCRNFDRDRAWCLTNQTGVLWDYCYVPVCGNMCYDVKSSRSLHRCPVKTSHCSEIEKLVSCHISHVEKTYEIECVDSWMMRRAIVSSLVEHNVITEQLRLKCFPSPCASENFLKLAKSWSYTGLLPYSQQIFCWSVIRLVNNGIAAITDTNKSTCYTSDKRRFLSAIQTKLEGMLDKTKFHISESNF